MGGTAGALGVWSGLWEDSVDAVVLWMIVVLGGFVMVLPFPGIISGFLFELDGGDHSNKGGESKNFHF